MRWLLLLHRWLGLAGGALLVVWCLSGFVMIYARYPALSESSRLARLEPISWQPIAADLSVALSERSRIESVAGRLVLLGRNGAVDLASGRALGRISPDSARLVAQRYSPRSTPRLLGLVESDQWTVSEAFAEARPLYRFALGDAARSELYVSSVSGQAVQLTTRAQRFWAWLGPIPHWLYLHQLRSHPVLWMRVVVATSLLGSFLTLTGLSLSAWSLARFGWRAALRPRSARAWHHASGVCFGSFALSWVVSGLLSVEPWGLFESQRLDLATMRGVQPAAEVALRGLRALPDALARSSDVSVAFTPLAGEVFFVGTRRDGRRERLCADGQRCPLRDADLRQLAARVAPGAAFVPLLAPDEYLGAEHGDGQFPMYRLRSGEHDVYLDGVSAEVALQSNRGSRASRAVASVHRLEISGWLSRRPLWDVLVLALLAGVSGSFLTGIWLGYFKR